MNAIDILRRELDPRRRRKPLTRGYVMLGGGVGDSYQPIEKKYQLTRRALQLVHDFGFPVHVLTKSTLVTRDVDILKAINERSRAIVSFSFSSVDDATSAIVEPRVPSPGERLDAIRFFKRQGIACGMFLLPVIPRVTDSTGIPGGGGGEGQRGGGGLHHLRGDDAEGGKAEGLLHWRDQGSLSPAGRGVRAHIQGQQVGRAGTGVRRARWAGPFGAIARRYRMPVRMPPALYQDILGENDLVVVILEHIDYLLRMQGERSPLGRAAYSISQVAEPLSALKERLRDLEGVGERDGARGAGDPGDREVIVPPSNCWRAALRGEVLPIADPGAKRRPA